MIFGRSTRNTHIYDEIRVCLYFLNFRNDDRRNVVQNPTNIHIPQFLTRPRPSNTRFQSTKIDFFDSCKKYRTDPRLEEPKLARNRKLKNLISVGNIWQNATFRHRCGRCLRRFCLIFSTNIENAMLLPRANFEPSTTGRFE